MGAHGWGCLGCFGLSGPLPDLLLWGWESTGYRLETEAEEKQLQHSKMATETCSSVCKDWHVPLQVVRHRSRQTESTLVRPSPALERTSLLCVAPAAHPHCTPRMALTAHHGWLLLSVLTAHRGWLLLPLLTVHHQILEYKEHHDEALGIWRAPDLQSL